MNGHAIACPACNKPFEVFADYLDFDEDWRLRCDVCAKELRLDHLGNLHNLGWRHWYTFTFDSQSFYRLVEKHLVPCQCGGSFRIGGSYRCPSCRSPLSREQILDRLRWHVRIVDTPRLVFLTNGRDERPNSWLHNVRPIPFESIVVPVLAILGTIGLFLRSTNVTDDRDER